MSEPIDPKTREEFCTAWREIAPASMFKARAEKAAAEHGAWLMFKKLRQPPGPPPLPPRGEAVPFLPP
jgi:hypothetical protein